MFIDNNNIIVLTEENKNWKKYQTNLSWYFFSSFDKKVLTLHKKQLKIISLKDLGQWMQIFYTKKSKHLSIKKIQEKAFLTAFSLFQWFDENTWEKFNFLYKKNKEELILLQKYCTNLDLGLDNIKFLYENNIAKIKTDNIQDCKTMSLSIENIVSFFFWLSLVYGNYMIKKKQEKNLLQSIKIQIPLFWIYLKHQEILDKILNILMLNWIFIQKNIGQTNNWIVYQLSITDWELLEIIWKLYQQTTWHKLEIKNNSNI